MQKRVIKALEYLLILPAFLPLLYVDGLLYPYVTPKTILLRAFGVLLVAAVAYLALSGKEMYFARLREKVTWIPGVLLAIAYVTSLFGSDFYHSFWSIFDRGDGLLTLTVIIAYFYTVLLTADEVFFKRFVKVVAWTGSLVGLYATLQWLQGTTGMNIPVIAEPKGRYGGTLGNAAFLAAYLGISFFVTLIAAPQYRGRWLKALYAGVALQILGILASATRGTLLALVCAGGVASLYLAWRGSGALRTYARLSLISLLVLVGIFIAFRSQLQNIPIEPVQRIASISLADGTVSSRVFVWRNMLDQAMDRPLLGVGAEHVDILFNRFYDPAGIAEQWFDRAHNVYLDYLVQFGIFGLVAYFALIGAFLARAWMLMRVDVRTGGLLVLLIATYAIQNFFVFDTAMSLWLFVVLFASVIALSSVVKKSALVMRKSYVPEVAGLAITALIIPILILPLAANLALAQGYRYHIADVHRAVDSMRWGLSLGTYADLEYGYQAYAMYTDRQVNLLKGENRIVAYAYVRDLLAANYARYPYDARTATYYAHILDMVPPEIEIDERLLADVVGHAQELSPGRMQPWYILANISLRKGDAFPPGPERNTLYREGIAVLETYAQTVPEYSEPRFVIATLFQSMGDAASAARWAEEALPLYQRDLAVARRAARYYVTVEDWPNAVRFLRDVVDLAPEDFDAQYDLAKTTFLAGNVDEARSIVERLRAEAPGLVETDPNFVAAINAE